MSRLAFLLLACSTPALAQATEQPAPSAAEPEVAADEVPEEEVEEITVTASGRPRGSVVGDIAPEVTLDARDIRAYGAANLGELLAELAPLTGSIQGRGGGTGQPVVLLAGRRISSFAEIRDLPPEAVVRVDILPEEVALKYGYRPDQKVVNFVLRNRFNAVTAEVEGGIATDGGRERGEADINYLRIAEGSRFSVDAEYEHVEPLFETDRRIEGADRDRTLLAATDSAKISSSYNRTILGNVSATATGELSGTETRAGLGRTDDGSRALIRDQSARTQELGLAFNGDVSTWRTTLNAGYTRSTSTTLTDRDRDVTLGRDRARSTQQFLNLEGVANGGLLAVPAGDLSATVTLAASARDIASRTERPGIDQSVDLSRDRGSAQLNLDLPVASRRRGVLSALGNLTVNLNGSVEELSDFGTLSTLGTSVNWEPIPAIRLIGSLTREEGAPTLQQLGNPVLVTPNVRILDVVTGQTVDVSVTEGGNPLLSADDRRVWKLGLTVRPIPDTDLTLLATYTDSRTDDPIAGFPIVTPELEAAFPTRFVRNSAGQLISIDSRPVNFRSATQRALRWGVNWSEALEAPPPVGPDGRPLTPEQIEQRREQFRQQREARGGGGPGGGQGFGRGGGGRGFGGGFGGGRQGRVQLSVFHTWRLEDSVLIRDGVPELDLLGGSATGRRGGQPRHEVQVRAGYNRNGLGARLNVDWQGGSRLLADPGGAASANDLRFSPLTTVNLRLFADLGQQRGLVSQAPWLRGARLTLAVDNLFNERLEARDASGVVPLGYAPDLLDPLGRSVRLELRKLFF